MNIKLTSLGLAALLLTTACSDDRTELINTGHEITFHTSVSRAANLTTANLTDFQVWAFSSASYAPFIEGLKATKNDNNVFTLPYSIYWPSEFDVLDFWAFAPSPTVSISDTETKQLYTPILNKTSKTITISGFTPYTAKQESGENGVLATKDQLDLIIAGKTAEKKDGSNGIGLTFKHALSQIVIKAQRGEADGNHHNVEVKGAWIVNAKGTGTLTIQPNFVDKKIQDDYTFNWTLDTNTPTIYGSEFTDAIPLTTTSQDLLTNVNSRNTDLLLLPHNGAGQSVSAWAPSGNADNGNSQAYILILCRVEAVHSGELPAAGDGLTEDKWVYSNTEAKTHSHQLFPTPKGGAWDKKAYGYTCVPIDINWEPGKRYEYNLTFCGLNSGAGIYPPEGSTTNKDELPTNEKYITGRPDGKNAGDPVLDNPISFTVTVSPWVNAAEGESGWTGGNVNMN